MEHDDTELSEPTPAHDGDDAPAVRRITPSGELDLATIDPVRDEVDAAVAERATAIVFDLTDVTFLDSSALAVFAYAARLIEHVQVVNPNTFARRVIEQTGLDNLLHLEP
jgi:anti-sigma B factor antagonist